MSTRQSWPILQLGDRNNFGNFYFFSKKKCIIHLVELDELFPKIWVSDLKTACGRCGAHAKVEKRVKRIIGLQVTWLNLNHQTDMNWIPHTSKKNELRQIFDKLSNLRKNHELKFQFAKCFLLITADNLIRKGRSYPQIVEFLKSLHVLLRKWC